MQCKHCGKQLEEGWVVCPFCRTAVSGEERQEKEQERRADCYEEYESLSPLPPAVRRAYEERWRKKRSRPEEQSEAAFQGTKVLKALVVAGSMVPLFSALFWMAIVIPLSLDYISLKGLAGAIGSAGADLARYLVYIAAAVGIGGVVGALAAWVRLRRIPILHRVLAAFMSFASRTPPVFALIIGGMVYMTWNPGFVPFLWMCGVFALLGSAYLGSLFYERGKTLVGESKSPLSVGAFVGFLRQGVPGIGKTVHRLYQGGLMMGILGGGQFRDSNVVENAWKFTMTMSRENEDYTIFFLVLMTGFDALFAWLVKRVRKKFGYRGRDKG